MKNTFLQIATLIVLTILVMTMFGCGQDTMPMEDSTSIPSSSAKCEHKIVTDPSRTPTCAETGCTEGSHCSICNEIIESQNTIQKVEHRYNNGYCIWCYTADPLEVEVQAAKKAFENLVVTDALCVESAVTIYCAWYFAIYQADDYFGTQSRFDAFISATELDYSTALKYLNKELETLGYEATGINQMAALSVQSVCINVAINTLKDSGKFNDIESHLSLAKNELQKLTTANEFYTAKSELNSYLNMLQQYYEFICFPKVTFNEAGPIIENYNASLNNYRNKLKVLFD